MRRRRLRFAHWALLFAGLTAGWSLPGCGGSDDDDGGGGGGGDDTTLAVGPRRGVVEMPAGAGLAPPGVEVVTSVGEATPAADGGFEVLAHTEGSQLTVVLSPGGKLMLAAFLADDQSAINARTTAEVLAYFGVGGFLIADIPARLRLLELLAEAPELEDLETAIATAVAADPEALGAADSPVAEAAEAAIAALLEAPATRGVVVNPAESKSGLTVNTVGVNSIQLTNEFRRRAYVWIDRVSYEPAGGGAAVPAPAAVTEFMVPPVTGLKSFAGTVLDIVLGNGAFIPVDSQPVALPSEPEGARKVTYSVVAVGSGGHLGDIGSLTGGQVAQAAAVTVEQLVFDMFLPLVINVLGPNTQKAQQVLEKMRLSGVKGSIIQSFIQGAPDLSRKLAAGDFQGAFGDAYNTFVTDSTLRETVFLTLASSGFLVNILTGELSEKANKPLVATLQGLAILRVLDAALQSFDTLAMVVQLKGSNQADRWLVDVTPQQIKLSPANSRIRPGGQVNLTATAVAVGDDVDLVYRWHNTAGFGDLTDVEPGHQNIFESSHRNAVYTAKPGVDGTDTVSVEVFQLIVGEGPAQRVSLGTAQATIRVTENLTTVTLTPPAGDIVEQLNGTVQMNLQQPPAGVRLLFRWTTTGEVGKLLKSTLTGVEPVTELENTFEYVVYRAGRDAGTDSVTVEVLRDDTRELLATHTTEVTVRQIGFLRADRELVVGPQDSNTLRVQYYRYWTFPDPGGNAVLATLNYPGQSPSQATWSRNSPFGFWDSTGFDPQARFELPAGRILHAPQIFSVTARLDHLDEDLAGIQTLITNADAIHDQSSWSID